MSVYKRSRGSGSTSSTATFDFNFCINCHKIATVVRDWQTFTAQGNKRSHQIGSWNDFLRAKHCDTCQSLVRLFGAKLYFNAFISISATHDRQKLSIQLYEKGVDPEEVSTKSYNLELLPSKTINPYGRHFIEASAQWISIDQIDSWIDRCDCTHEVTCQDPPLQNEEGAGDVIFIDVQKYCLVKGNLAQKYIALSYVWGQQRDIFRTVLANVTQLMQANSLSKAWKQVPATIQDAIILARGLNIQFLWVDRLCIVQDDTTSIEENLAQMASVYARSCFTIIATEGDSESGILGIPGGSSARNLPQELVKFDDLSLLVVHKDIYFGEESSLTEDYNFPGSYEPEGERTWHERAWTFQERMVSRRCLIFNNESVTWECNAGIWTELQGSRVNTATTQWHLKHRLWPDAKQYAVLCEGFSKRKLTYAGDALKAFDAITQSFTPSFPDGFFFAMPEFMFDLALLWSSVAPHNARRVMFPSWSWIAWEGRGYGYEGIELESAMRDCWGPTLSNDDLRIFRRPLNIWKKRSVGGDKTVVLNNSYHVWLNAEEDKIGDLPGWKSAQHPRDFTLQELGFSSNRISHPVPVASNLLVQASSSSYWEPLLYSRVQTATFRFAGHPNPPWGTVGLMDADGIGAGNLRAHDRGDEDSGQLGITGSECCLMAVCEAWVPEWTYFIGDIHFTSHGNYSAHNPKYPPAKIGQPFKWVDVLWIEYEHKIAYRRGVGQVWLEAWERASPKEVDIILG